MQKAYKDPQHELHPIVKNSLGNDAKTVRRIANRSRYFGGKAAALGVTHMNLGTALFSIAEAEKERAASRGKKGDAKGAKSDIENGVGYYKRVLDQLQKAVDLNPENPIAHYNMGSILYYLNMPVEALMKFRTATRLDPRDPMAYNGLGYTYYTLHNLRDARENFRKAYKLDPKNQMIAENYKRVEEIWKSGEGL